MRGLLDEEEWGAMKEFALVSARSNVKLGRLLAERSKTPEARFAPGHPCPRGRSFVGHERGGRLCHVD
jgi:hypothetical protein